MKTIIQKLTFSAAIVGMAVLAGCGNKEQPNKPAYDPAPSVVKEVPKAVPADNSVRFYGQNLELAKEVWTNCRKQGPANMTPDEKKNCANAQSAWEMQPYKARK